VNRRIATLWLHNVLVTPFIPLRLFLLLICRAGEAAEWVGFRMPGWRMSDGWEGW
jgi:hypothetical protein